MEDVGDEGPATLTRALDVHEVGVGGLHEALELVLLLLELSGGVEEVDGESLRGGSGRARRAGRRGRTILLCAERRGCFCGCRGDERDAREIC